MPESLSERLSNMLFSREREGSKAKRARGRIALPDVGLPPLGRLGVLGFSFEMCRVFMRGARGSQRRAHLQLT